ncbi:hypothetical protein M408DRAFT_23575 [Serendipita vermifera MAFF 305830]|uniref:F-box domain-containing protein n=1 Tax=Serendipita vermifera MAFF 305830 TaxID=933852 RepID=A0A0C2WQP2_SERVB|nr:hypothetical protein M408DRAFT_23575 [Serendipita vermifera MAFF 305830]
MWAPADLNALPTNEDYINAKTAILEMENELADALLALAQIQIRIANLEKDIYERRAWIAPIRKLGFDVLSLIFERCSEGEWNAPLKIGAVSRGWRTVVLNTPYAWSIIDLEYLKDIDAVDTYLRRSGTSPIHARILYDAQERLRNISNRISCAFIWFTLESENLIFPCLRRLRIGNNPPAQYFKSSRFPALRHLVYTGHLHYMETDDSSSHFEDFPLLETLATHTMPERRLSILLRTCSSTLVTLSLAYVFDSQDTCTIKLPSLIFLRIHRGEARSWEWPLNLVTPALQSYIETDDLQSHDGTIHKSLENVTNLRLSRMPPLSKCIQLRRLQIATRDELVYPILKELAVDKNFCPNLEAIEVHLAPGAPVNKDEITLMTLEITKMRERPFQVNFHPHLRDDLPGFPVELCDSGMPCRVWKTQTPCV